MRAVLSLVAGTLAALAVTGCGDSKTPLTARQMPSINDPLPRGNCTRTALTTPVPNPTVTGPIPATVAPGDPAHDYPFFATQFDLAAYGFVEEEYFFENPGYKTRMVVRRPASADQFNCTLLVEWYNTTNGYDVEVDWIYGHEQILRDGYAWVGISAQATSLGVSASGVAYLAETWSPARYGSLHIDSEGLAFDIFAQGIKALRAPGAVDPMGGLPVTRAIVIGASQSAIFEQAYYNSNQSRDRLVDGYLFHVWGAVPLNTDAVGIPVLKILSELEIPEPERQPDSANYRIWEVAGTAHQDYTSDMWRLPLMQRDLGPEATLNNDCEFPPRTRTRAWYVYNAALRHITRWLTDGIPPPTAPPIKIVDGAIERDAYGNAVGGLRIADHEVATATNTAENSCARQGRHVPFSAETLRALYPTHADYVARVRAVTAENVEAGYLLVEDAARINATAQAANIPP